MWTHDRRRPVTACSSVVGTRCDRYSRVARCMVLLNCGCLCAVAQATAIAFCSPRAPHSARSSGGCRVGRKTLPSSASLFKFWKEKTLLLADARILDSGGRRDVPHRSGAAAPPEAGGRGATAGAAAIWRAGDLATCCAARQDARGARPSEGSHATRCNVPRVSAEGGGIGES